MNCRKASPPKYPPVVARTVKPSSLASALLPLAADGSAAGGVAADGVAADGAGRAAATGSVRSPADSRAKTSLWIGFTGAAALTMRSVQPVVAVTGGKQTRSLHA